MSYVIVGMSVSKLIYPPVKSVAGKSQPEFNVKQLFKVIQGHSFGDQHSAADSIRLPSFSFFSGGLRKTIFFRKSASWPFKVIQCHWFWHQSKARLRIPI